MSALKVTVGDVVHGAIERSYERMRAQGAELRVSDDPETVHQARVAIRRLRSDLATFERFVDPHWAADLRADLRWLGSELGAVRDAEVQRDRLREHASALPPTEAESARRVIRRLDADREAARFDLLAALTQARFTHVSAKLAAAAERPVFTQAANTAADRALRKVVRGRWKKIRRAVHKLGDNPSDDALHAVRVRAKQCRYAAEACEPALGKPARRLARAMAGVQDVLGEHHDAIVAGAWLAKTAHECSPAEAYAIGMLAQIEVEAADRSRREFPAAWERADTTRVRGWL